MSLVLHGGLAQQRVIIVIDRPRGGMSHIGPFNSQAEADEYRKRFDNEPNATHRVVPLRTPEDK